MAQINIEQEGNNLKTSYEGEQAKIITMLILSMVEHPEIKLFIKSAAKIYDSLTELELADIVDGITNINK